MAIWLSLYTATELKWHKKKRGRKWMGGEGAELVNCSAAYFVFHHPPRCHPRWRVLPKVHVPSSAIVESKSLPCKDIYSITEQAEQFSDKLSCNRISAFRGAWSEAPQQRPKHYRTQHGPTRALRCVYFSHHHTRLFRPRLLPPPLPAPPPRRYLQHLPAAHGQRHSPALQAAAHILRPRTRRHLHLDEHLLQGLVPAAPGRPAGHHPAPLLERSRHVTEGTRTTRSATTRKWDIAHAHCPLTTVLSVPYSATRMLQEGSADWLNQPGAGGADWPLAVRGGERWCLWMWGAARGPVSSHGVLQGSAAALQRRAAYVRGRGAGGGCRPWVVVTAVILLRAAGRWWGNFVTGWVSEPLRAGLSRCVWQRQVRVPRRCGWSFWRTCSCRILAVQLSEVETSVAFPSTPLSFCVSRLQRATRCEAPVTRSLQLPWGVLHPRNHISTLGSRRVSGPESCAAVLLKPTAGNVCVLLLLCSSKLCRFVSAAPCVPPSCKNAAAPICLPWTTLYVTFADQCGLCCRICNPYICL